MRHLTPHQYRAMPWANGRGTTTELVRVDGANGMLWRLSMAQVIEDGEFSLFPGIDRSLTVIDGPGFDLVGQQRLRADPLCPVAFAGDQPIVAAGVTGPAVDFNVMWARASLTARVRVLRLAGDALCGAPLCLFAPEAQHIDLDGAPIEIGRHDLIIVDGSAVIEGRRPLIVVEFAAAETRG